MATFELYRASMIGRCLMGALGELVESSKLSPGDANQVLLQFDESIAEAFKTQVRGKVTLKGGIHFYRYCDHVWTFNLRNFVVENDESQKQEDAGRVKIVACDSKLLLF